jgi:hypothetical protein
MIAEEENEPLTEQDGGEAGGEEPSGPVLSRREIEQMAVRLGWRPFHRWKGDAGEFVDAPQYLQHAETQKRRVDHEQRERTRERQQYEARTADFERRLQAQAKLSQRNLDLQKQALIEKFEDEKRQALGIDDPDQRQRAYDGATKRERDAFVRVAENEREFNQTQASPLRQQEAIHPEVAKWAAVTPWVHYVPDEIKQEGVALYSELEGQEPQETVTARLHRVSEIIQTRHPSWFPPETASANGNSTRRASNASVVETGGANAFSRGGSNQRAKGFKDLPSEARSEFNKMITEGYLRPMRNETPESAKTRLEKEYAKSYWEDYGE